MSTQLITELQVFLYVVIKMCVLFEHYAIIASIARDSSPLLLMWSPGCLGRITCSTAFALKLCMKRNLLANQGHGVQKRLSRKGRCVTMRTPITELRYGTCLSLYAKESTSQLKKRTLLSPSFRVRSATAKLLDLTHPLVSTLMR